MLTWASRAAGNTAGERILKLTCLYMSPPAQGDGNQTAASRGDAPRLTAGEPTLALLARPDHGRTPPHSGGAHSSTACSA